MDVATSLKLLGAKTVTVVAREQVFEFPASKQEYKDAIKIKNKEQRKLKKVIRLLEKE